MKRVIFWGFIVFLIALPFVLDIFVFTDKIYPSLYSILIIPGLLVTLTYPRWSVVTFIILVLNGYQITIEYYVHHLERNPREFYTKMLINILIDTTALLVSTYLGIKNRKLISQLESQATVDPLTGVFNRRYFNKFMEHALPLVEISGDPFALITLDVDHFKEINDKFGHLCGDFILRELASIIKNNIRSSDKIVRFGGEEFVIVMPKTKMDEGINVGESVRKIIEDTPFVYLNNKVQVTISMGLAMFSSGESTQQLVERTDKALYQAKANGRNQLVVS